VNASMIDISGKRPLKRTAVAEGSIKLKPETIETMRKGKVRKGDPLVISEIVAITAVKKTSDLIPLCHQIPLEHVGVSFDVLDGRVKVQVTVSATAKTGVEMEALLGVVMALTTVWDMVKYLEKDGAGQYPTTRIEGVRILRKEKHEP